ncbi:MAG: ACT domain-containing protein, partial [Pseudomonadota bacterium]
VILEGDAVGRIVTQGPGAGEGPTASAVVADIVDIARGLQTPAFGIPAAALSAPNRAAAAAEAPFYLRLSLADRPGTLAAVAEILGRHGVSIDRMRQMGHVGDAAPVLIVTHATGRTPLDAALDGIASLDVSVEAPVAYRIEAL